MKSLLILLTAGSLVAGCGNDEGRPGASDGGRDAGRMDAMPRDTGRHDTGGTDTGATDALGDGAADTTGPADSAVLDAPIESGPVPMPCTAVGTCDPFDVASCPPGESCRPTSMGTACRTIVVPAVAEGDTCTTADACGPGLLCLDFGTGFVCHRMCPAGSIGACGPSRACSGTLGEVCVRACLALPAACDIYAQDCADPTAACTLVRNPETSAPLTGCRPEGSLGLGQACGAGAGRCARGMICARDGAGTMCRQVCGPSGTPPTCTVTGETCSGLARSWSVTYCR